MQDFYLKFPDEATAKSVLYTTTTTLAVVDSEGNVITPATNEVKPNFANIDIIGTIYESPPEPTPDANPRANAHPSNSFSSSPLTQNRSYNKESGDPAHYHL